jgi:hypothetical protein
MRKYSLNFAKCIVFVVGALSCAGENVEGMRAPAIPLSLENVRKAVAGTLREAGAEAAISLGDFFVIKHGKDATVQALIDHVRGDHFGSNALRKWIRNKKGRGVDRTKTVLTCRDLPLAEAIISHVLTGAEKVVKGDDYGDIQQYKIFRRVGDIFGGDLELHVFEERFETIYNGIGIQDLLVEFCFNINKKSGLLCTRNSGGYIGTCYVSIPAVYEHFTDSDYRKTIVGGYSIYTMTLD